MTWWSELLVGIGSGVSLLILSGVVGLMAWCVRRLMQLGELAARSAGTLDALNGRMERVELELWPVPTRVPGAVYERTVRTTASPAAGETATG